MVEEVITQPKTRYIPSTRKTITPRTEQIDEEVIVEPTASTPSTRQRTIPMGQVTNLAHSTDSKTSHSWPKQPSDFPALKPASGTTVRSISEKNKDNEEALPLPGNTEKPKKQGSLEA